MRCIVCAALVCSMAFSGAAQTSDAGEKAAEKHDPPPGTLHAISIKGNQLYSSTDIIRGTGLTLGQPVSAAVIEQARKKLQATELFNDIADEYRFAPGNPPAYDLTFEVVENQQLFPMRFERIGLSADAARACLKKQVAFYSDRIPGTEGVLKRYTSAVQDCVAASNPNLKVHAVISNDDPNQLAVLFAPETPAPTISQVIVTGNQAVDTGTILRAVNQVAVGVPISDVRIKMILDGAIRPLYAAKGYAAVSFPKVETETSKDNLGVVLKVQIADGPTFKFGVIRFHGSGLDQDVIRSTIPFKPGQSFNGAQVDNFRLAVLHDLRHRGYLDASIVPALQIRRYEPDRERYVQRDTWLRLQFPDPGCARPGYQKPTCCGTTLGREEAGRPFNPDYPDFFLKRVQQEGIFDNLGESTRSDYTADAATHTVTVHLYFKGGESAQDRAKHKKEEDERKTSDGSWSPW